MISLDELYLSNTKDEIIIHTNFKKKLQYLDSVFVDEINKLNSLIMDFTEKTIFNENNLKEFIKQKVVIKDSTNQSQNMTYYNIEDWTNLINRMKTIVIEDYKYILNFKFKFIESVNVKCIDNYCENKEVINDDKHEKLEIINEKNSIINRKEHSLNQSKSNVDRSDYSFCKISQLNEQIYNDFISELSNLMFRNELIISSDKFDLIIDSKLNNQNNKNLKSSHLLDSNYKDNCKNKNSSFNLLTILLILAIIWILTSL